MYGFFNRILTVDAERRSFEIEEIPDSVLKRGLGGKGLGSRLLLDKNPPGVDPLSPENRIIFATGPVTGSKVQGSCRYGVFSKSPLTGFYAESYSGGRVPEAVSRTGFDALIIKGASSTPVALEINEDGARFHPAGDLWGMDTHETEREAARRWAAKTTGLRKSGAVVIGPAGENLVRFALIKNDLWRSAGRTGMGAVLGSKKIKALVFNGGREREWADPALMDDFVKAVKKKAKTDAGVKAYQSLGTPMLVATMNEKGGFPAKYWSQGVCAHWEKISAQALKERCRVRPRACLRCNMACGRLSTIKSGRHAGLTIEGPEYETIYAFGGLCLIDSIEEIAYLNDICDRLGLDTITAGNLCAFAIEASRRGRLKEKLDYGDPDLIAGLLRRIAFREGLGDLLAEGIKAAAREWGLEDLAVHVKGLEPAGYDPRLLKGTGLSYAVAARGACHLRATFYKPELAGMSPPDELEGKAGLLVRYEDRLALFDTLILCRFFRDMYEWEELVKIVESATGLGLDQRNLEDLAKGVIDDTRRFNLREGLTPADDTLPPRLYKEPLESGAAITEKELHRLRDDYYQARGWDEEGRVIN
ncbi:MAG: aldehyde ferredoxin oxidoreductase family protein [Thermodesulfobacteriota bacterium]|nr:aldehyde ferredoxin oxidoreductase family protein [Thermodesulfobacteriota bacterium]